MDFALYIFGIEHAFFQLQPLKARRDAGQIACRRMASRTAARAVEIGFAGFGVAGLKIGHIDAFPLAALRHRLFLLVMDECDEIGDLLGG